MGNKMNPTVYIETTIPSYLTAWRSSELQMAANQQTTRAWWDNERKRYDLYVSQLVLTEIKNGDLDAAERRMQVLEGIQLLDINDAVRSLAERLVAEHILPETALDDALHIAVAAVHGLDYLLTWNCKHIANAIMRPKIEQTCRMAQYEPPVICTPLELMDGE